jgi:C-terminal processing protease CtpA/Prc
VRALAKGGPSANSGMINVGDELVRVEDQDVHGRPLSELGQFILGVPGTSVLLTFISRSDKTKYEILLVRSKVVSIPPEPFLPLGRIIRYSVC